MEQDGEHRPVDWTCVPGDGRFTWRSQVSMSGTHSQARQPLVPTEEERVVATQCFDRRVTQPTPSSGARSLALCSQGGDPGDTWNCSLQRDHSRDKDGERKPFVTCPGGSNGHGASWHSNS